MDKPLPRLPRAEPFRIEDYLPPEARIDLAVEQLKELARHPEHYPPLDDTPVFSRPAAMPVAKDAPTPSLQKVAGVFSRAAAGFVFVGFVGLMIAGQNDHAAQSIRHAVCALPLLDCQPK